MFRTRNQVNDMATAFNAIPYPFSPLYNEHEFHGSARQSQISVLAEGNIDAAAASGIIRPLIIRPRLS